MVNVPATAAAGIAVLFFLGALLAMTAGSYSAAGFSFLCASLVIYFRETRLIES